MTGFDERLQHLQEQVARQGKLRAMLEELYRRVDQLEAEEKQLAEIRVREQDDVDKLENGSLAAFFYSLRGCKEEKLEQERQEARAAAVKHDAVVRRLDDARKELWARREELDLLAGCEERYQRALEEKAQEVKRMDPVRGAGILNLEREVCRLQQQEKELGEAIAAGDRALFRADQIAGELSSAEGWGTWDLLGGGLLTDLAKHSHLDQAQSDVEQLQVDLDRFRTELADVEVHADIQAQVDGFLRFADFFFDGLFADWAVLDQIGRAQSQTEQTRARIQQVLDLLKGMSRDTSEELTRKKQELDKMILRA